MDAGAAGAQLMPRDAYRFAKGEKVMASSGQPVKLSRPLGFLAVADHSDNTGFFPKLLAGDPSSLADPKGREWYDMIQPRKGVEAALAIVSSFSDGTFPKALAALPGAKTYRSAWGKPSRRQRRPTSRDGSPPASATSGPRAPAATACTAASSIATTAGG